MDIAELKDTKADLLNRAEQLKAQRQTFSDVFNGGNPLTVGEFNILSGILERSTDKEADTNRFTQALIYNRQQGIDLADAYANIEALNEAQMGKKGEYTKAWTQAVSDSFRVGELNKQRSELGMKFHDLEVAGKDTAEVMAEIDAIDAQIEQLQDNTPRGLGVTLMKWAAGTIPYTGDVLLKGATAGMAAALVATGVGAVAGVPMLAAATLGTSYTLASLAYGGAALAFGWKRTADLSKGAMYYDLRKQGVEKNIAEWASSADGWVQGAVENFLGLTPMAAKAVGNALGREAATGITTRVLSKMYANGIIGGLAAGATKWVQGAAGEGAEEFFQSIADSVTEYTVAEISDSGYTFDKTAKEVLKQALYEGVAGFGSALVLGGLPAAINTRADIGYSRNLKNEAELIPSKEMFIRRHQNDEQFSELTAAQRKDTLGEIYDKNHTIEGVSNAEATNLDTDYLAINESADEEESEAQATDTPQEPIKRRKDHRLHTQESTTVTENADGSESHTLKLGSADSRRRYGRIEFTVNGDTVTIDNVYLKAGQEALTGEFVTELMRRYEGYNIEWQPGTESQIKVRDQLVQDNTQNPGQLQRFKGQGNIDETLEAAGYLKEKLPNLNQHESAVAAQLLGVIAAGRGKSLHDFIHDDIQFKTFAEAVANDVMSEQEAALNKGAYQLIEDGTKAIIYVGESGDFSTLFHEVVHFISQTSPQSKDLAQALRKNADTEQFRKYLEQHKKVLDNTGLEADGIISAIKEMSDNPMEWNRAQNEIVAVLGETYAQEGRTFNSELKGLFDKIIDFFMKIYRMMKQNALLNDDIVKAYDALLAGNPELKQKYEAQEQSQPQTESQVLMQGKPTPEEIAEADRQYAEVEAQYKGTEAWMKAPNGKPTKLTERQWVQVRTPLFKAWFGDWENDPDNASKVVDENGEPRVVYHGTPHGGFDIFNGEENNSTSYHMRGKTFFSSSKRLSTGYMLDRYNAEKSVIDDIDSFVKDNDIHVRAIYPDGKHRDRFRTTRDIEHAEEIARQAKYLNAKHRWVKSKVIQYSIYFGDEQSMAHLPKGYTEEDFKNAVIRELSAPSDAELYQVFLNIRDPRTVDYEGKHYKGVLNENFMPSYSIFDEIAKADKDGNDGTIIKNVVDPASIGFKEVANDYIAFSPEQIKSATDNIGTFNEQNPSILFQIIGEQGAERLDAAEESNIRLDNLSIARQMEQAGKDAQAIRLATGWERGADGKWRYEIPDGEFSREGFLTNPDVKEYRELERKFIDGTITEEESRRLDELKPNLAGVKKRPETVGDYYNAPELYRAYPEIKDMAVRFETLPVFDHGQFDITSRRITLNNRFDEQALKSTLIHEIQHAIQLMEGFAMGGNTDVAGHIIQEKNKALQSRENKAFAWRWKLELEQAEKEHPEQAGTLQLLNTLIEEYTEKGTYTVKQLEEEGWLPPEDVRAKGFNLYVRGYDKEGYENAYNEWQEEARKHGIPRKKTDNEAARFFLYRSFAGEVEARNAQARMNMTPEQRRETLLSETEDVAREDQIVLMNGATDAHSNLMFQPAYHGSGASFDQFDTNYMGTGEGAQAFGWGIYLTQSEGIAKSYAEQRRNNILYKGENWNRINEKERSGENYAAMDVIEKLERGYTFQEAIDSLRKEAEGTIREFADEPYWANDVKHYEAKLEAYNKFAEDDFTRNHRNLYTVSIPDDNGSNYLYWDKNYLDEKDTIRRIVDAYADEESEKGAYPFTEDAKRALVSELANLITFPRIYERLSEIEGSPKAASELLSRAGFVGIDYPANSLSGGNKYGKRNFVIFNDNDITINNHLMWQGKTQQEIEDSLIADAKGQTLDEWLDFNRFLGDSNLDEAALTTIWEKANHVTEVEGEKVVEAAPLSEEEKDAAFRAMIDTDDGVRKFIQDLRSVDAYIRDIEREGMSDEEDMDFLNRLADASKRIETEAAPFIKNLLKNNNELSEESIKKVRGMVEKNLAAYRDLYAAASGNENLTSNIEALPFIDEPTRERMQTMSIAEKRRLVDNLEAQELKKKILKGEELYEGEAEKVVKMLDAEIQKLEGEKEALKASLDNKQDWLDIKEKKLLNAAEEAKATEKAINKLERNIRSRLDKGMRISKEDYQKLAGWKDKLELLQDDVNALNKQTKLKAILQEREKYRQKQAELKQKQKERQFAKKVHDYKVKLASYIMKKPSKTVNWEQAEQILALQAVFGRTSGYDNFFINMNGKRMNLTAFRSMVEREAKAETKANEGKTFAALTPYQWKRYFNKSLAEYTVQDLETLADTVRYLTEQGRHEWQAKVDQRAFEAMQWQNLLINEIAGNPRYTDAGDEPLPETGESEKKKRTFAQLVRTGWYKTLNMARKAQILDGNRKATAYRLLVEEKRAVQEREYEAIRKRMKPVTELMEKLGVKAEDFYEMHTLKIGKNEQHYTTSQLIYGLKAQLEQRNMEAFVYGNLISQREKEFYGHNDNSLRLIGEARLDDFIKQAQAILAGKENIMKVAEAIWNDWQDKDNFARLNRAAIDEYNMPVDPVAFYMPISRKDFNGTELAAKIADDLYNTNAGKGMTAVEKGMTKTRLTISPDHQMPVDMDYFKLWTDSVADQEHFIASNAYVRKLNRVFKALGSKDLRANIEAVYGQGMMNDIDNYINEVANPDINTDTQGVNKFLSFLRGALYPAYLAFKSSSVILQMITSPAPFLREVGPVELAKGLIQMSLHPVETWKYVTERSAMMENRSMNPLIDEVKKAAEKYTDPKYKQLWHKIQETGTMGLEMADRWAVTAGWLAVFDKKKAEYEAQGMEAKQAEREAVKYADAVVLETQPTGDKTELAPLFKVGGPAWQAFTQFQVSLNVIWNNLTYDVANSDFRNHEVRKAMGTLIGYALAGVILYSVQEGFDDDDDAEDIILKLLYGATTQYTSSIPLVSSNIDNIIKSKMTGEAWYSRGSQLYPGLDALAQGVATGNVDKLARAVGIFSGAPVSGWKEFEHSFYNRKKGEWRFYPKAFLGRREK